MAQRKIAQLKPAAAAAVAASPGAVAAPSGTPAGAAASPSAAGPAALVGGEDAGATCMHMCSIFTTAYACTLAGCCADALRRCTFAAQLRRSLEKRTAELEQAEVALIKAERCGAFHRAVCHSIVFGISNQPEIDGFSLNWLVCAKQSHKAMP